MLVVGEQIGEEGNKAPAPAPPPPPCGLYAGVSGVRGGDGERLPGWRMDGRNLRSRRRSGGVRIDRLPAAEPAGDISGVGDPAGPISWERPRRERKVRWKAARRRFRRRSHRRAKHMMMISARTEQTATAALPCPVRLLPEVVDAAAAVGSPVSVGTGFVDWGFDPPSPGEGLTGATVEVVGAELVNIVCDAVDCIPTVAADACIPVAEQPADVLVSVLHLNPNGGGPGSMIE